MNSLQSERDDAWFIAYGEIPGANGLSVCAPYYP